MFDLSQDPFSHFARLHREAHEKKLVEPDAMTLATVGPDGQPSARVVYFKGLVRGGFSFYTNYQGQKGREIEQNPKVCLNFYRAEIWEQIRIDGVAEKLTRAESEAYFRTRARLSQLGAWASDQSSEIPDYEFFKNKLAVFESKFAGQDVPCPPHWGGYRVVPSRFEFWFGQNGRLHERYVYTLSNNIWKTSLLSP